MKYILLAISGSSPQIVTCTLYGIAKQGSDWPEKIINITTSFGKKRIIETLTGENNHLEQLCNMLNKPIPKLEIMTIVNQAGEEIKDATSLEENEDIADFIVKKVAYYTQFGDDLKIHTSIAGGRKTMTFYMGYAMSLFGRKQDKMSHVFVTEGYENHPNFFYPTEKPGNIQINLYEGDSRKVTGHKELDTSKAEVILADIPFILLGKHLAEPIRQLGDKVRFHDLVKMYNINDNVNEYYLRVQTKEQTIEWIHKRSYQLKKEADIHVKFDSPLVFLFFIKILETVKNPCSVLISRKTLKVEGDSTYSIFQLFNSILELYGEVPIAQSAFNMKEGKLLKTQSDENLLIEVLEQQYHLIERKLPTQSNAKILISLQNLLNSRYIHQGWYDDRKRELIKFLDNKFIPPIAEKLKPLNLTSKNYALLADKANRDLPNDGYWIDIPAENILIE